MISFAYGTRGVTSLRLGLAFAGMALVVMTILAISPAWSQTQDRALYVWKLVPKLENPEVLLSISKRARVQHLFLSLSRGVLEKSKKLVSLLERARGAGLKAHAVLSENSWALSANRGAGLSRIRKILAWNRTLDRSVRLAGIHLDVEVHALPRFKRAKHTRKEDSGALAVIQDLLKQWLDWTQAVVNLARKEKPPLEVSVAVPHWFLKPGSPYQVSWGGQERAATHHLMRMVDEVVVMAYSMKPSGIARLAAEEMALAARPGMARVRVAVSVSHRGPADTSLFQGGRDTLEKALAAIHKTYADARGFSGTAIHMFEGLRLMGE